MSSEMDENVVPMNNRKRTTRTPPAADSPEDPPPSGAGRGPSAGKNKRTSSRGEADEPTAQLATQRPLPDESLWPDHVVTRAKRVANVHGPALIIGDIGTGKTTLCELIHRWSGRPADKCERVPCGTLQATTLLSTLFGHKRGSFTGAEADRDGLLNTMNGGSIILDDLDCLNHEAQTALLGFLETGKFSKLGEDRASQHSHVRILATCNREPHELLARGVMRADFLSRMQAWAIRIPPLPNQIDVIGRAALRFLKDFQDEQGTRQPHSFSRESLELLGAIHWKNNLRDLMWAVRNIALVCNTSDPVIQVESAAHALFDSYLFAPDGLPVWSGMKEDDRMYRTLALTGWNIRLTARVLGVSHQTVYNRIKAKGWPRPS